MSELYWKLDFKKKSSLPINSTITYIKKPNLKKITSLKKKIWIKSKKISKSKKAVYISLYKPKNQFFTNIKVGRLYTYSTGLIIKALGQQSRSLRRGKLGFNIMFNFILKKLALIQKVKELLCVVKSLNNYSVIRTNLIKYLSLWGLKTTVLVKITKNYTKHNYKKISYINKRMRKKYIIE